MPVRYQGPAWRHPLIIPVTIWVLVSVCGLVPPFSRDALNDHLMLPLLWERHGLFWRDGALGFTAYPPLADIPYILFAGHSWDWMASLWHALGALVTLIFLDRAMKNLHVPDTARQVVLLSWAVSPVVVSLITWCYVDLWLCAFTAMAVDRLSRPGWKNSDALIFGLIAGLGMLVKYNAIPLVLGLMLALLWRWGKAPLQSIRHAFVVFATCLLVSGWWYMWNWLDLGNFLYPLGEMPSHMTWLQLRVLGYHEPVVWAMTAPLRQFFWGVVNQARFFDGMLHPLWLAAFAAPVCWKHNRRISSLFVAGVVYILFACTTGIRARYWLPGMVAVLPLVGCMLMKARGWKWKGAVMASFLPPVMASMLYLAYLEPWQFWLYGRHVFLQQHVPDYGISRWAARNLPSDSRVYLLWNGGRAYYMKRAYGVDFAREGAKLKTHLSQGGRFGYTHILMRRDLADRTIGSKFPLQWRKFLANSCQLAKAGPYEIREVAPCRRKNGE